jgi:sensor histidine kinase YesM
MISKRLILSDKSSDRIKRHLLFWFCWWLYSTTMHAANPMGRPEISYFRNIPFTMAEAILLLVPQVVLTYYMLYFVTTNFLLKKKYWLAFAWTIPGWFVAVLITMLMVKNLNAEILSFFLAGKYLVNTTRPPVDNFFMGLMLASKAAPTIAAMAVGIKFIKHWYLKEQRNMQLLKENAEAQLQLLTAQVHPHFLFNTLNNIYSQTQTESPLGSKMIMELSDLLRYILAEGNKPLVPLRKELAMIKNYMDLERIRYGNKLDLHVSLPDKTGNLHIAPLLLLPFVENCFKHGASKFLKFPWVNLKIELYEKSLTMKLINGKDLHQSSEITRSGTGINNVKKRLDLLYSGQHDLEIIDEPEVFVVNLKILLCEKIEQDPIVESKTLKAVYA